MADLFKGFQANSITPKTKALFYTLGNTTLRTML
jgi:hypothetical protein